MSAYATYQIEVRHDGLHKYRLIKGTDRYVVEQKATAQQHVWQEIWEKKQAAEAVRVRKQKEVWTKEAKKALAAERTAEAQQALAEIEQTLVHTLDINDRIEWDSLLDRTSFPKPLPPAPSRSPSPREPKESDQQFRPVLKWYPQSLADFVRKSNRKRRTNSFLRTRLGVSRWRS